MEFSRRGLLGAGMARLIDPVEHVVRTGDEELGYVPQRELVRRQDQQARLDAQSDRTQRTLIYETLSRVAYNVPANTDTIMSDIMAASSSAISLMIGSDDVPMQCRVSVVRIKSNAAITAGTVVPFLEVYEGSDTTQYVFNECELGTSVPQIASAVYDWESAIQIASGALWLLYLRTDASFAPTTADIKIHLTFSYEQWTPS